MLTLEKLKQYLWNIENKEWVKLTCYKCEKDKICNNCKYFTPYGYDIVIRDLTKMLVEGIPLADLERICDNYRKFPHKVGDKLYIIENGEINECEIVSTHKYGENDTYIHLMNGVYMGQIWASEIGVKVFSTREQAQRELEDTK